MSNTSNLHYITIPIMESENIYWYNEGYKLYNLKNFKDAIKCYEKSIELGCFNAYNNLGAALSSLAQIEKDETLFQKAFEKYEEATKRNFAKAKAFKNWGIALLNLYQIKKDGIFPQEFKKYENATKNVDEIIVSEITSIKDELYTILKQS